MDDGGLLFAVGARSVRRLRWRVAGGVRHEVHVHAAFFSSALQKSCSTRPAVLAQAGPDKFL